MKRLTKLVLCGLTVMVLAAGCSKKEDEAPSSTAETSAEETAGSVAEGEAVDLGKVTKLGEYKGVEVTKMSTEVTDEELETRIQRILDANPEYVVVTDRAAENGDILNIDFKGLKDGVAFDNGSSEGYELELGSGTFIEGFEEGLVGAKTGEERTLNLTFPEDYYSAELAGQAVVFEVKVNSIEEKKDAVLDDNFVQRMSDFNTVDEFRADTLANLEEEKKTQSEQQLENDVLMAVVEATEFELNEAAVEESYNQQMDYHTSIAGMYGMALEDYVSIFDMTEDSFKETIRSSAETSIQQQLVAEAIAEKEGMEVEDADREAVALENGMDLQTMQQTYGEEETDRTALLYKVVTFLKENASVK